MWPSREQKPPPSSTGETIVASGVFPPATAEGNLAMPVLSLPVVPESQPDAAPENPQSAIRSPQSLAPPLLKVPLRLVGVIGKLYVILESDRGLVLMDQ